MVDSTADSEETDKLTYLTPAHALDIAQTWLAWNDEDYIVCWLNEYNDSVGALVRKKELAELDLRLPQVIDHFCNVGGLHENGFNIRQTYSFWQAPGPLLPDVDTSALYLLEFHEIVADKSSDTHTCLHLSAHETGILPSGVEIYGQGHYLTCVIANTWLNEHYPGVSNRILAGNALGYSDAALLDYAFPDSTEQDVTHVLPTALFSDSCEQESNNV